MIYPMSPARRRAGYGLLVLALATAIFNCWAAAVNFADGGAGTVLAILNIAGVLAMGAVACSVVGRLQRDRRARARL